ncbi:LacI family transcriptional regulator [Sagittula marina]|uniref:LacI family transcriptional regulator n=1 Tax=Sagittula marina TaxID=943940 RepID=A0A7W6DUQ8_9RHOB|nr:LacI family DNA-binding transcriptional regulator [Sagittula marina]MBB3988136.1 LacI family transcriptional regulator [Sagittula marina]
MSEQTRQVGIRDVARAAQVSTATVSRALNSPSSVSARLRDRIDAAIRDLGYIPDASARALSSRRTRTVGAIVPTVDNAMFARGLQALQSYLSGQGYLLLLATNEYDLDVELEQARNLVSRGIDGLILRGDARHPDLRRMLKTQSIPFVNVGVYDPTKPYPSVGVDNFAAGQRITRHLTDLGHRHVAIVSAIQRNNDRAQARTQGVLSVLQEVGAEPPEAWRLQVNYNLDEAKQAARVLFASDDRPTAVICGNDVIAYGVMMEAIRMGLDVPTEVSFAGFDDLDWSHHLSPSLTTIHMPTDEIWAQAGQWLVSSLDRKPAILHRELDFSLVVRDSTAPARR